MCELTIFFREEFGISWGELRPTSDERTNPTRKKEGCLSAALGRNSTLFLKQERRASELESVGPAARINQIG